MEATRLSTAHEVVRLKTALARLASREWKLDEGPDDKKPERWPWSHRAWERVWTSVVLDRPIGVVLIHRMEVDGELHNFVKDGRERMDALVRGFDVETVRRGGEGMMPCVDLDTREARYGAPAEETNLVPLGALWHTDLYEGYRRRVNVDGEAARAVREARVETLQDIATRTNEYMLPAITFTGCGDAEGWEIAQALQTDPRRVWPL